MNKDFPTLLLAPWSIATRELPVSLLHIVKKDKSVNFSTSNFKRSVITKEFHGAPKPLKDLLLKCCAEDIGEFAAHLKKLLETKEAKSKEAEFSKSLIRHWHKIFSELKPFFPLLKWYHKKEQPGKKALLTAPCIFSTAKPKLNFEVIKVNGGLTLKTFVELPDRSYSLQDFTHYHFFLTRKDEYFILGYMDYITLEVILQEAEKYTFDPQNFEKQIIVPLEKDYRVNRNNLFPKIEISETPANRLLLTELNNSFLMLTPQWVYDGFVIDGSFNEAKEQSRNGISYLIKRNHDAEEAFMRTLVSLHKNFANQRNGFFYLTFADAIKGQWFLKVYQEFLKNNIELVGMDMLVHFRYSPHPPKTEMVLLSENDDILTFQMEVSFGKESIPLNELQKMLLAGQKAVMLKDSSLGMLGEGWLNQYAAIIKHGKINKQQIEVLRWMAAAEKENGLEKPALRNALRAEWWEKWKRWQGDTDEIFPLSNGLKASLRPYQQKGI